MVVTKMSMCLREAARAMLRKFNPHQPNIIDNKINSKNLLLVEKIDTVEAQHEVRAAKGNLAMAAFRGSRGGGNVYRGTDGKMYRGRGRPPPAASYHPYQTARGSSSGSRGRGTHTNDLEKDEQRLEGMCFPKCFPLFSLCTRAGLAPGMGLATACLGDSPEPAPAAAPISPRDRAPAVTGMEMGTQYQIDTIAAQHKKRALNGNIRRAKRVTPSQALARDPRPRGPLHTQLYQVDTVARQHRVRARNGNIVYGGRARPRYGQYGYNPRRNPYSYDPHPVERRGQ
eukprot:gene19169-65213_t